MKIAPRLPPWHRYDGSELGWSHIPSGVKVKELILASEDDELLNLHKIFTEFYPHCCDIILTDADDSIKETYDWNLPRSIRAAYVIAGDLFSEGQTLQSARMVFFAALLHECLYGTIDILDKIGGKEHKMNSLQEYKYVNSLRLVCAFIHHTVVNAQTVKLLLELISEMHPNRGWAQELKPMYNEQQVPSLDRPLYVSNVIASTQPMQKLITLFLHTKADQYQYREFQIYENATLQQLFTVCYLLSSEFAQVDLTEHRYSIILYGLDSKRLRLADCHLVVSVNKNDLYLTISGERTRSS
jgi:hypothetical protein